MADDGKSDIFIHKDVIRSSGFPEIQDGASIVVLAEYRRAGRNAVAVEKLERMEASDRTHALRRKLTTIESATWAPYRVKWFSAVKGYGFIETAGPDAFLHMEIVRSAGLHTVKQGATLECIMARDELGRLTVARARIPRTA